MITVPSDEKVIGDTYDRFGQELEAMLAAVIVPAMGNLPDFLPSNFKLFTIGIDSLTPHLIFRLAGVTKPDGTVEQQIKKALYKIKVIVITGVALRTTNQG